MDATRQHTQRLLPGLSASGRSQPHRKPWQEGPALHVAVLLAWSLFLFGLGIDRGDLYRNETLRAYLAQEMMTSGNWLVPHLYGEPLLTKPPLGYWLTVLISLPHGEVSATTARISSALLATLVLLAVYWWSRQYLPAVEACLLALLLPCFPLWLAKVPSAEIDFHLLAFVTLGILIGDRWLGQPASCRATAREGILLPIGFALCLAAGTLTKWTAAIYVYVTLLALLGWRGGLRRLFQIDHLLAVASAGLLVAGWLLAVVRQVGWSEVARQLWVEAAPRLSPAEHVAQHPEKLLWLETAIHPLLILACAAPLGLLAPLALRRPFIARQEPGRRRWLELLHCWAWPNLLLFTLLPEHATRHSLPICPPLVLLGGFWLLHWRGFPRLRSCPRLGPAAWTCAVLICWFGLKLAMVEVVVPQRDAKRRTAEKGHNLAGLVDHRQPLFVCQWKDEGLAFYGRHPAMQRVRDWSRFHLHAGQALLTAKEWEDVRQTWNQRIESQTPLVDSQGDTIHLIRFSPP